MQALTGGPRAGLLESDVAAIIHADDLLVDYGADLLGLDDEVLEDRVEDDDYPDGRPLYADITGGEVQWNGSQDIARTASLTVARELRWDRDRLRPWMDLSSADVPGVIARFYTGVLIATAPESIAVDEDVPSFDVTAFDKLHLLGSQIGDTHAVEPGPGVTVGGEVTRLLTLAGYRGRVAIDPALFSLPVPDAFVWAAGTGTTWLRAINDLLASAGCQRAWCDEDGTFRAALIVPAKDRPEEWIFDAQAPRTIVGPSRRRTADLSQIPNVWRFTAANHDLEPIDGDGGYFPPANEDTGPTSVTARGRRVVAEIELDAIDQAALVRQGDERIARDIRAAGVRTLTVGPLPLLGHDDVVGIRDTGHGAPVASVTAVLTSWTLNLAGGDGTLTCEEIA